jgi:two-component system response regulator BaeR
VIARVRAEPPTRILLDLMLPGVELTAIECGLLATLLSAPGRIFTREQLIERSYRDHRIVSDRTIDSHVKKLRRKLAAIDPGLEPIQSVYGVGYRYEESASAHHGG